jgi:hypothetical protein
VQKLRYKEEEHELQLMHTTVTSKKLSKLLCLLDKCDNNTPNLDGQILNILILLIRYVMLTKSQMTLVNIGGKFSGRELVKSTRIRRFSPKASILMILDRLILEVVIF